jgi:hypothetical protein
MLTPTQRWANEYKQESKCVSTKKGAQCWSEGFIEQVRELAESSVVVLYEALVYDERALDKAGSLAGVFARARGPWG